MEQARCVQVQLDELPARVPKASFNLSLYLVMMLCRNAPCVCPTLPGMGQPFSGVKTLMKSSRHFKTLPGIKNKALILSAPPSHNYTDKSPTGDGSV